MKSKKKVKGLMSTALAGVVGVSSLSPAMVANAESLKNEVENEYFKATVFLHPFIQNKVVVNLKITNEDLPSNLLFSYKYNGMEKEFGVYEDSDAEIVMDYTDQVEIKLQDYYGKVYHTEVVKGIDGAYLPEQFDSKLPAPVVELSRNYDEVITEEDKVADLITVRTDFPFYWNDDSAESKRIMEDAEYYKMIYRFNGGQWHEYDYMMQFDQNGTYEFAYMVIEKNSVGVYVASISPIVKKEIKTIAPWSTYLPDEDTDQTGISHSIIKGTEEDEFVSAIKVDGGTIAVGNYQSDDLSYNNAIEGYSNVVYAKYDTTGKLLWKKSFGGSEFTEVRGVVPTSDGGVLFYGGSNSGDGDFTGLRTSSEYGDNEYADYLTKLDSKGNVLWTKVLPTTSLYKVTSLLNGKYAFIGGEMVEENQFIGLLDEEGNIENKISISYGSDVITPSSDGGFYTFGYNGELVKYNENLEKVRETTVGLRETHEGQMLFSEMKDGSVLIAGYDEEDNEHPNKIAKIDKNGNLVWKKFYDSNLGDFTSGQVLEDGRFLVSSYKDGEYNEVLGMDNPSYGRVSLFNADGTLVWTKNLVAPTHPQAQISKTIVHDDGNVQLIGGAFDPSSNQIILMSASTPIEVSENISTFSSTGEDEPKILYPSDYLFPGRSGEEPEHPREAYDDGFDYKTDAWIGTLITNDGLKPYDVLPIVDVEDDEVVDENDGSSDENGDGVVGEYTFKPSFLVSNRQPTTEPVTIDFLPTSPANLGTTEQEMLEWLALENPMSPPPFDMEIIMNPSEELKKVMSSSLKYRVNNGEWIEYIGESIVMTKNGTVEAFLIWEENGEEVEGEIATYQVTNIGNGDSEEPSEPEKPTDPTDEKPELTGGLEDILDELDEEYPELRDIMELVIKERTDILYKSPYDMSKQSFQALLYSYYAIKYTGDNMYKYADQKVQLVPVDDKYHDLVNDLYDALNKDYDDFVEERKATDAEIKAESSVKVMEGNYDPSFAVNTQSLIDKVEDATIRAELQERLDNAKANYEQSLVLKVESETVKAVEKAESTKNSYYISEAYKKVSYLTNMELKFELTSRLQALETQMALEKKISDATRTVELAEQYKYDSYISSAQTKISTLPDGETKTSLQQRLDALKAGTPTSSQSTLITKAKNALSLAISLRTQYYVDKAQTAINLIEDATIKEELQAKLNAIIVK